MNKTVKISKNSVPNRMSAVVDLAEYCKVKILELEIKHYSFFSEYISIDEVFDPEAFFPAIVISLSGEKLSDFSADVKFAIISRASSRLGRVLALNSIELDEIEYLDFKIALSDVVMSKFQSITQESLGGDKVLSIEDLFEEKWAQLEVCGIKKNNYVKH